MFSFFLRKIKNPAGEVRCRRVAAIQLTVRDGRAPRGSHGKREAIAGQAHDALCKGPLDCFRVMVSPAACPTANDIKHLFVCFFAFRLVLSNEACIQVLSTFLVFF